MQVNIYLSSLLKKPLSPGDNDTLVNWQVQILAEYDTQNLNFVWRRCLIKTQIKQVSIRLNTCNIFIIRWCGVANMLTKALQTICT